MAHDCLLSVSQNVPAQVRNKGKFNEATLFTSEYSLSCSRLEGFYDRISLAEG